MGALMMSEVKGKKQKKVIFEEKKHRFKKR